MPTRERCCEACDALADVEQTSAHHARVVYLCPKHGRIFHAMEFAWREAVSTVESLARIDFWLRMHRELSA